MPFADQFLEAADGARTPAALDELARKLWRAHAEGCIADADTEVASEAIEARRAALSASPSFRLLEKGHVRQRTPQGQQTPGPARRY
jgi:hypothetical protein